MRQRVLIVSSSLAGGGAERFVATLAAGLDRSRFEPSLALLQSERQYPVPDDVKVRDLGQRGLLRVARTLARLRGLLARERCDVVLSGGALTSLFVGSARRLLPRSQRPRWIARVGNDPAQHPGGVTRPAVVAALRRLYRDADRVVANSRGLALALPEAYPIATRRLETIANPVDLYLIDGGAEAPREFVADPSLPVIIAVGRLARQKRPDLAIDAFAHVRTRFDAELWLVGDGPLRGECERQVARLGLEPDVRFLGSRKDPHALMRQAQIFLLASDFEGLPNALIEAQALGIPAVATHCRFGPEEIVDDTVTGLLAPCDDAQGLGQALCELLADDERRREMGKRAAERARARFDSRLITRQWEHLLQPDDGSRQ